MDEILNFLKSCGTFYLATIDGDQPRVRPFGAVCKYDGNLYIVTNNQKKVYAQMRQNPKIEISGMSGDKWIRLEGIVELDDRHEARVAMLNDNPTLSSMYSADDNLMVVLRFVKGTAAICSFTSEPQTYTF